MNTPMILAISLWRGALAIADEVRRTPTALILIMLVIVVVGTLVASQAR